MALQDKSVDRGLIRMDLLKTTSLIYKRKVAIIGAGYVGASIAYSLMLKELAREIVLIDKNPSASRGEALDIRHGIPYMGSAIIYDGDYSDCADCDLIIITAGRNRRPNESRLDMAQDNISFAKDVVNKLLKHYTKGVILVVTNPVDIVTYKIAEWAGLPNGIVFGTGCLLDSSRFVNSISDYVGLNTDVISGTIVGEHGESQIPIWSKVTVAGMPIEEYCDSVGLKFTIDEKTKIAENVKRMGTEIISCKGKTHYGIATCVCFIADAILNRRATISSVCSVLTGEYGVNKVALSLPSIIGGNGVEKRIIERWSDNEFQQFKNSENQLTLMLERLL